MSDLAGPPLAQGLATGSGTPGSAKRDPRRYSPARSSSQGPLTWAQQPQSRRRRRGLLLYRRRRARHCRGLELVGRLVLIRLLVVARRRCARQGLSWRLSWRSRRKVWDRRGAHGRFRRPELGRRRSSTTGLVVTLSRLHRLTAGLSVPVGRRRRLSASALKAAVLGRCIAAAGVWRQMHLRQRADVCRQSRTILRQPSAVHATERRCFVSRVPSGAAAGLMRDATSRRPPVMARRQRCPFLSPSRMAGALW